MVYVKKTRGRADDADGCRPSSGAAAVESEREPSKKLRVVGGKAMWREPGEAGTRF